MPTPTLFINTAAVGWTPGLTGGTALALKRITQAGVSINNEVINARADLDIYDSSAHIVGSKPTVTFSGYDVATYMNLTTGIGRITWTTGNADNPGGTGSLVWLMSPAMNPLGDYSGAHGQYASGNLSFMGLAQDGLTNPLSYTVSSAGSFMGKMTPAVVGAAGGLPKGVAGALKGLPFTPIIQAAAPADGRPADLVLIPSARHMLTPSATRNMARLQVEGARALGLDPGEVAIRSQGPNRVVSAASARVNLLFPQYHDLARKPRYDWHDRGDGVLLGYLTDAAKESDEDGDEDDEDDA